MSTTLAKTGEIERKWYLIDAAGKPLGRAAKSWCRRFTTIIPAGSAA